MSKKIRDVVERRVQLFLDNTPPADAVKVCEWIQRSINNWEPKEAEMLAELVAGSMFAYFRRKDNHS